jgi:hypothetical protein
MWGTSSPDDKLTGDLTNVIEAISIYDRGSDCLAAGKLAPGRLPGQQLADELSVIVDELRNDPSMAADTAA